MNKKKALQIIRETRQNYNVIAKEWNVSRQSPSGIKMAQIRQLKKDMTVLDVGCGNGFLAPLVMARGANYVGLDLSEKLIAIAKKKYKKEIQAGAKFLIGDMVSRLSFRNETFDRIFSFAAFHHIPSNELRLKALREMFRVLKKKGQVVIIVWNLRNKWSNERFNIEFQLKLQIYKYYEL